VRWRCTYKATCTAAPLLCLVQTGMIMQTERLHVILYKHTHMCVTHSRACVGWVWASMFLRLYRFRMYRGGLRSLGWLPDMQSGFQSMRCRLRMYLVSVHCKNIWCGVICVCCNDADDLMVRNKVHALRGTEEVLGLRGHNVLGSLQTRSLLRLTGAAHMYSSACL